MNNELKKIIVDKILNENMTLEDSVEYIWNLKDNIDSVDENAIEKEMIMDEEKEDE